MKSDESEKTKKSEQQLPSIVAIAGLCCGALFGAMVSGLEKLVELDWGSKPFGLLAYILVVESLLFGAICVVFALAFFKWKKQEAINAAKGITSAASAFQSVESADLKTELGSEQQDELGLLKKKRLRSEIKMHKAVTRCAKEARQLIMSVAFWLFISAMNRSDH